jgi:hypothetical protein
VEERVSQGEDNDSRAVERLVVHLRALGALEALPMWGRASSGYDHMGAKLADAVLQSGVRYEGFVRPRVDRIAQDYPDARTTSSFLALLRGEGAAHVLRVTYPRKLRTIMELAQFLAFRDVESTQDLSAWLQDPENGLSLRTIHGVGPKTVSFLKLLVGLDAIAVDRQILRFVHEAGVNLRDPVKVEAALSAAGRVLDMTGEQVDQLVWRAMAGRKTTRRSARSA